MKDTKKMTKKYDNKHSFLVYLSVFIVSLFLIFVLSVDFVKGNGVGIGDYPPEPPDAGDGGAGFNPLRVDTFYAFIALIINDIVIPIGTTIAILAVIYSGFLFVTAQGNPERLTRARSAFTWAVIGGLILIGAWAIALAIEATMAGITTP